MVKYEFPEVDRQVLEKLNIPMTIYQFIDKRVVTLALSEGFCRLFGFTDKANAYDVMDNAMYCLTHPDDAARVAEAAVRSGTARKIP